MLKKFPPDKINITENGLFFLLQVPTHHSFTFNLWFLYELNHKIHLSKTLRGFPFSILFYFYWSLFFCSTKSMDSLTLKVTLLQNYFLSYSSPWCVINDFFYLKKKCFVLEISRFSCFCEIHKFQILWHHHKHCCIMEFILLLFSFKY